jgi:hypothetical protein
MLDAPHGAARAEDFVAKDVQVVAVDDIVPAEDFRRVRVVKIDVEGYEIEVLRGMEGLLRAAERIAIFVETSPEWTAKDPARFVTKFCNEHALSAYVLRNDYSLEGYFPRRPLPPVPVRTIPLGRQDLMLVTFDPSRADGDLGRDA